MVATGGRWRWRRSPLRRRWDVLDAWLGLLVAVGLLLAVPVTGALTGLATQDTLTGKAQRENRDRHEVPAVLLENAPRHPLSVDATPEQVGYEVKVRWTAPDGTVRTGYANVQPGQRKGTATTVWTDDRGLRARPPMAAPEIVGDALAAGVSAAIGVTALLLGAGWTVRARLDRKRLEDWDRDWAEVGPRWGHEHT
jgi:hypothetical protein